MQLLNVKIIDRKVFEGNLFLLKVENRFEEPINPGQFFQVRVSDSYHPLLRRPFSVFEASPDFISFLIQVKGIGTKILKEKHTGEYLDLIGPLGNSFPVLENVILVAGGTGIAPLNFYAKRYRVKKALWGLKHYPDPELVKIVSKNIKNLTIITEDGSSGNKGLVTDFIENDGSNFLLCGPVPMLKEALRKIPSHKAWISIEGIMGCGFGICMGCAVKKKNEEGYYRICTDGPVFKGDEVEL